MEPGEKAGQAEAGRPEALAVADAAPNADLRGPLRSVEWLQPPVVGGTVLLRPKRTAAVEGFEPANT